MVEARRLLLRMEQIDKRFPGVHALDHVDFDLYEGEIHVLLGENGAGKSTLMKILSGAVSRDGGRIWIGDGDGPVEVSDLTPERTRALGIGMVYQELSLVPYLSVAENIFLGRLPRTRWGAVDWAQTYERARQRLQELGVSIDPRAEVRSLSVAEQQLTEIARVLESRPRILVLDEPTSALSDTERTRLFALIRRLKARGVGVIYISHRLAEIPLIGDRVTILRDGKRIATLPVTEVDEDRIIQMMVGRKLTEQYPWRNNTYGEELLRVENLSLPGALRDVSFTLRQGEILGVFGLMGAGQNELARALCGLEPRYTGQIWLSNQRVNLRHPWDAIRLGVGLLPRDRRDGLVPLLPIPPNITLGQLCLGNPFRILNLRQEIQVAGEYVKRLHIHPPILNRPVFYLSGGNQQKVVLARWLCSNVRLLVLDDPTRGIDVGAKAEVFMLMEELSQRGVGILFVSSEMEELLAMADRILVLRQGQISAEYRRGEATEEDLLRSASYEKSIGGEG
ncbi:MAG: sugar ABC transporter ATP-binding protein [Caldilineaceae bacterium]|nr:sugar ABC transporter ATP-binding protein [Caldilineaceae bacterium]